MDGRNYSLVWLWRRWVFSGLWRSQWEALVSSPVKGVPRAGWALNNDLEILFGSLIYGSVILIAESQGWEGLLMLPLFLGVPITLLLWSQGALFYCFWNRWGPQFSRVTLNTLSPQTQAPIQSESALSWSHCWSSELVGKIVSQSGAKRHTLAGKVA